MTAVAEAAGVSLTTVSHVLNHTRRVSESTRRRVLAAAESIGYYDQRVAAARQTRKVIGVVVPSAANPYFGEMLEGIDAEAAREGATILLTTSNEDSDKEYAAVRTLLDREVDMIILVPSADWRQRTRPLLKSASTAVVLADRLDDRGFDQVGSENTFATQTVVAHLLATGHSKIGLISGLAGLSTSREREDGFRLAHERHGISVDENLIWQGKSTIRGGFLAAIEMLHAPNRPTALFCGNNNMTIGLVEALHKHHVNVPDDLAFVAFDDLEWGDIITPPITSVAQPFHAMGSQAVQLAVQRLQDPVRRPRTVRLPASIEHRESCGCLLTRSRLPG